MLYVSRSGKIAKNQTREMEFLYSKIVETDKIINVYYIKKYKKKYEYYIWFDKLKLRRALKKYSSFSFKEKKLYFIIKYTNYYSCLFFSTHYS